MHDARTLFQNDPNSTRTTRMVKTPSAVLRDPVDRWRASCLWERPNRPGLNAVGTKKLGCAIRNHGSKRRCLVPGRVAQQPSFERVMGLVMVFGFD
jgi:hypothetical protein